MTLDFKFTKEQKARRESKRVLETAIASDKPFSYLRDNLDEWTKVRLDEFILLLRKYEPEEINSHELADILERYYNFEDPWSYLIIDLCRLLRDKHIEREKDGRDSGS